jgi:hypothetical protein
MALPSLHKEWQGGTTLSGTDLVNVVVSGTSSEELAKNALFQIKDALTTFNSNPWTVAGSSDSSASSMDGTDRWIDTGDLVYRTTGGTAFSWIVLEQSQINPNFQVLFGLDNTSASDANRHDLYISVSPAAGFGTAASGTDGSTTALPTATDEHVINSTTDSWYGDWSANFGTMVSCFASTDGEVTRVVASDESTGIPFMRMNFEVPRLPDSTWHEPCVYSHQTTTVAGGTSVFKRVDWMEQTASPYLLATVSGYDNNPTQQSFRFSGPMWGTNEVITLDEDHSIRFYAGELTQSASVYATQTVWGTLYDCYWVSRGTGGTYYADDLDTFPAAGNRTFVCVGDLVYGWLNDSTTDLKYENI